MSARRNNVVAIAGTKTRTLVIPLDMVETAYADLFELRTGVAIEDAVRDFIADEIFDIASSVATEGTCTERYRDAGASQSNTTAEMPQNESSTANLPLTTVTGSNGQLSNSTHISPARSFTSQPDSEMSVSASATRQATSDLRPISSVRSCDRSTASSGSPRRSRDAQPHGGKTCSAPGVSPSLCGNED